jgi:hypothetical protein
MQQRHSDVELIRFSQSYRQSHPSMHPYPSSIRQSIPTWHRDPTTVVNRRTLFCTTALLRPHHDPETECVAPSPSSESCPLGVYQVHNPYHHPHRPGISCVHILDNQDTTATAIELTSCVVDKTKHLASIPLLPPLQRARFKFKPSQHLCDPFRITTSALLFATSPPPAVAAIGR